MNSLNIRYLGSWLRKALIIYDVNRYLIRQAGHWELKLSNKVYLTENKIVHRCTVFCVWLQHIM